MILFLLRKILKDRVFKCMRVKCTHNYKYVHNLLTHAALLKRCFEKKPSGERKKRTKVLNLFLFFFQYNYLITNHHSKKKIHLGLWKWLV